MAGKLAPLGSGGRGEAGGQRHPHGGPYLPIRCEHATHSLEDPMCDQGRSGSIIVDRELVCPVVPHPKYVALGICLGFCLGMGH